MSVVIIDNYDSFTFNLFQLIQPLTEEKVSVFRNDQIDFVSLAALKPSKIVLSPGPGHPENEVDFGVCRQIITRQKELAAPLLGVCLGHQGIVHHLGGKVVRAPQIVHGKASRLQITGDSPLLAGLPHHFSAMRYHSLVASDDQFPDELTVTAREAAHGLIMSIRHKNKPIYGVQFHPESIGTPEGQHILRNFIERC